MSIEAHYEKSSLREKIIEHIFIGEALRTLWRENIVDVEILRSEFDAFGYDLVFEQGKITRHVQLKAGLSKPRNIGVSEMLAQKQSGCVVYIKISEELDFESYYWFGGVPDAPMPPIENYPFLRRTTPNSSGLKPERKRHRNVPASAFIGPLTSMSEVLRKLLQG